MNKFVIDQCSIQLIIWLMDSIILLFILDHHIQGNKDYSMETGVKTVSSITLLIIYFHRCRKSSERLKSEWRWLFPSKRRFMIVSLKIDIRLLNSKKMYGMEFDFPMHQIWSFRGLKTVSMNWKEGANKKIN